MPNQPPDRGRHAMPRPRTMQGAATCDSRGLTHLCGRRNPPPRTRGASGPREKPRSSPPDPSGGYWLASPRSQGRLPQWGPREDLDPHRGQGRLPPRGPREELDVHRTQLEVKTSKHGPRTEPAPCKRGPPPGPKPGEVPRGRGGRLNPHGIKPPPRPPPGGDFKRRREEKSDHAWTRGPGPRAANSHALRSTAAARPQARPPPRQTGARATT